MIKQTKGSCTQSMMYEDLVSLAGPITTLFGGFLGLVMCVVVCGTSRLNAISRLGREYGDDASQGPGDGTSCVNTLHQVFR